MSVTLLDRTDESTESGSKEKKAIDQASDPRHEMLPSLPSLAAHKIESFARSPLCLWLCSGFRPAPGQPPAPPAAAAAPLLLLLFCFPPSSARPRPGETDRQTDRHWAANMFFRACLAGSQPGTHNKRMHIYTANLMHMWQRCPCHLFRWPH